MEFCRIGKENYAAFHAFMTTYYRGAEDKDTPQEDIDAFISMLYQMVEKCAIQGRLVTDGDTASGVVLWMKDTGQGDFSQRPGYGTILEIGVAETMRNTGIGKQMVVYAEYEMAREGVLGYYICAYGPAQDFWKKCGYVDAGEKAANGLPMFVKG